jgi:hypothetical protein
MSAKQVVETLGGGGFTGTKPVLGALSERLTPRRP